MLIRRSTSVLVALLLTSCGNPQPLTTSPALSPDAPAAAPAPGTATVTMEPDAERVKGAQDTYAVKAIGPVTLFNAVATRTAIGANAGQAIDNNPATQWRTALALLPSNPTLTLELNVASPVLLKTLTLNTTAFQRGSTFNVQTSTNGTAFTNVLTNQTKGDNTVTLTIPAVAAATAKFVRISCNMTAANTLGIREVSATADIPVVVPPGPPAGTEPGNVSGTFPFTTLFGSFVQYRPDTGRLRFESVGLRTDTAQIALDNMAQEALAATPTHRFRGRGEVFRAGANNTNGALLGAADVFMVQPPDEPGVIVATDAVTGNDVEIIWPSVAQGIPGANAIVRVQLNNAPTNLDQQLLNVRFTIDKINAANQVVATWTGTTNNVRVNDPNGGPVPAPGSITGNFTFQNMVGSIPQYRPGRGRLRLEAFGVPTDPAMIALTGLAGEALAAAPTHQFEGTGRIFRRNANGTNGALLGQATVTMVQPPGEPGVIVATDPVTGHDVEIIWPAVAQGIPGDAIVRIQLNSAPLGLENTRVNADFTIRKRVGTNTPVATWTGSVTNVLVPLPR